MGCVQSLRLGGKIRLKNKSSLFLIGGGVVFFLVYWSRLLLQPKIPIDGNMLRLFHPSWVIGKDLLSAGFYFLWDPTRNMGQPFLADPQNQALYPLRLLSPFLSFLEYQRIFVVFHVLLAAGSAALLAQKLFKEKTAPLFLALVIGFSPLLLIRVTLSSHFATMAWTPVVLLLLVLHRPILLGVALAIQWMAGFPPYFILSVIFLFMYSFSTDNPKSKIVCLFQGGAMMAGLAAIQWIPFLEMINNSIRPVLLPESQALIYAVHPIELFKRLLMPSFVLNQYPSITQDDPAIVDFYIGPFLTTLSLWSVFHGKKREKVLIGLTLFSFAMALGPHLGLSSLIPGISVFRYPANWMLIATTAIALLATSGWIQIPNKKWRWGVLGLVALDLLIFALPMRTAWADLPFITQSTNRLKGLGDIPSGTRVFHSSLITRRVHLWNMKSEIDWFRMRESLIPSIGAGNGIKETSSYSVLTSRRQQEFINRLDQSPLNSPLFDMAGISRIVAVKAGEKMFPESTTMVVIKNDAPLPHAFMDSKAQADIIKDIPGEVIVRAEGPGTLVLSEAYAPGWQAWVDHHKQSAAVFEEAFVSVGIPEGMHEVRFRYFPRSFLLGLCVSLLTVLALVVGTRLSRD